MDDNILNARLNAISGKEDIILTREANEEAKIHDLLLRISALQAKTGLSLQDSLGPKARRLGKKSPKVDARTLKLAKYLPIELIPNPSADWSSGLTSWGMMMNDNLGDCTIAGCGHAVQGWSAANKAELTLPDWVILHYYEAWDGYVLGDSNTDNGGVELDVLNNWRKFGFGLRANHIGADGLYAYADPDPGNTDHVKLSIQLFGGVYIGVSLPNTAQNQTIWDVVGNPATDPNSVPGSWGGHCVWVLGYDTTYLTFVTWGGIMKMTWAFWKAYCDESHTLLSNDWVKSGNTPSGFNLAALEADLALVTG